MKYKVTHSLLSYTKPNADPLKVESGVFKRDQYVTDAELTDAGFDVEFLKRNDAIELLEGQDDKSKAAPAAKNAKPKDD